MRQLTVVVLLCAPWLSPPIFEAAAEIDIYYAPEDRPLDRLLQLYTHARHYIYVSVYGMTSPAAVKALIEAKRRGVDVRIITDGGRLDDPKQRTALEALRLAGVPIRISRHDGLMHLKQVVIDDEVNVNGSMNQTTSGNRYNDERLDVINDPRVTARARRKFLSMWADRARYSDWTAGRP
ncbi:MAG TPA: phospholipase D-like domain-containing protein [Nitrospiraceae bacterium]|nr:phospholipase D-like domain-containing protein [Nitrospiraceae bacterium]